MRTQFTKSYLCLIFPLVSLLFLYCLLRQRWNSAGMILGDHQRAWRESKGWFR